jgi:hypothetical protein
MPKKIKFGFYKVIVGLCIFFLMFANSILAQGYDLSYSDVGGDVVDSETGQKYPSGYEHIDILQIISSELTTILDSQLIFQMTVVGAITNSDDITYTFFILEGNDPVYYITYSNNIATGVNMADGSMDILQASGTGTDTLEVSVQLSDVGEVNSYDFGGATLHVLDGDERYLVDAAGNSNINTGGIDDLLGYGEMPITIRDPRSGATVSGTRKIMGVTNLEFEMESVEVQMDSKADGNWILATTFDSWGNWSYELDTTSLTDGKHRLHARAYNGSEYFFDTIEIYVNQENANSPESTGLPVISVGDSFHYRISADIPSLGGSISYTSSGTMNLTVERIEDIISQGNEYNTFKIQIEGVTISEFEDATSVSIQSGYDWLSTSDLTSIKSQILTTTTVTDGEDTFTTSSTIAVEYDPPMDKYDFPISIGSTWEERGTIYYSYDDGTDTMDETIEGPFEFEALHVEDVTVSAGTFETFVIWSRDFYSGEDSIECQLEYHSPDLGFPVLSEMYDSQRNIYYTAELVSYEKVKEEDSETEGLFGMDNSNLPWIFIIIILIAIVLIVVVAIRRKRSSDGKYTETRFEDLKSERPVVHALGPTKMGPQGALRFVKCPQCSKLMSIERGIESIKCPYCGLIQKV